MNPDQTNRNDNDSSCGKICVSVAAPDVKSVLLAVQPVLQNVDVIEIRLDAMEKADVESLASKLTSPLLFTHRPSWEGGSFTGLEERRIEALLDAIGLQVAYVDFELAASHDLRDRLLAQMDKSTTKMIISAHDFKKTPSAEELSQILQKQKLSGAHIGKIVTTAHNYLDVLRVLNLQQEAADMDFPLCAFCMGPVGRISRVATLMLGGYMTYAALNAENATAPGQLTVSEIMPLLAALN